MFIKIETENQQISGTQQYVAKYWNKAGQPKITRGYEGRTPKEIELLLLRTVRKQREEVKNLPMIVTKRVKPKVHYSISSQITNG